MTPGFNGPNARERQYTVRGEGVELFVREMGDGPRVVVLHGGPGAHHDYLIPGFDSLADEFHLYFYDQRGGGRSKVRRPKDISWRDHVADLELLRAAWDLDSMTLLGYSWGGLLALLHATQHPAHVSCMVLVDPAAGWGDYQARFKAELDARMDSAAVAQLRNELEASGLRESDPAAYRKRRFEISVAAYFRDPRAARDLTPFLVQGQAEAATWGSLAGYEDELKKRAAALGIPTLILHGRHDPLPLEWAEELASTLPRSRFVVLENSGHVPFVEEPEPLMAAIRPFLRECAVG